MNLLDVVAILVMEDGQLWGDAATDAQISDMRAFAEEPRPYHFATRARGYSKTRDLAGLCLGKMVTDPAALIDWLAADKEQGQLAIQSIVGFLQRTPALASQFTVTANKVVHVSGSRLEVLAADAASAFGRRTSLMVLDEFANWPDTESTRTLYWAMRSTLPKIEGSRLVIITNSGSPSHFAYNELEHARTNPLWRVSEIPGPPPWMDPIRLEEQRASLPAAIYEQLWENRWVESLGDFLDPAVLDAAFTLPGPVLRAAEGYHHSYHAALDVGIVKDASVLTIGHREGERTLLDYQVVWQGSRAHPVDLAQVGAETYELLRAFDDARLIFDPYQALELAQRLDARGIVTSEFHFSTQSKMRLASALLAAFNTGAISLYEAPGLHAELAKLRVVDAGSGMWSFDHRPGEHDDRSVSLAMMLLAATTADPPGTVETIFYAQDPTLSPVIRRGDFRLAGKRYLDETDETDGWGEPIRQPPPGWTSVQHNPMLRGARPND
jgi:hypothetical protein